MFKPIDYQVIKIGRLIKASKVRYTWDFELDKKRYTVHRFVSKVSRKEKIIVNGDMTGRVFEFEGGRGKITKEGSLIINDKVFRLKLKENATCYQTNFPVTAYCRTFL